MQVSAMRLPPLAARKHSHKLKLRPTVVPLNNTSTATHTPITASSHHSNSLSQENNHNESASLRRQNTTIRSISSARNRSCQLLNGSNKPKIGLTLQERTDIPQVSAKSWMLYELRQGRCLYGKRNYKKKEMASLTKMMSLITILQLMERTGAEAKRVRIRATKNSCSITGTTAQLKQGAIYSLQDLYFGMMLPSGNDAAYLIAELGGVMLRLLRTKERSEVVQMMEDVDKLDGLVEGSRNVSVFLKEMNRLSWELGMHSSNFANPHGLSNHANYSTALDLCKLCAHAMKNPLFRNIVKTQQHAYHCEITPITEADKENQHPNQFVNVPLDKSIFVSKWENTNKMLGDGWSGIKTGVTPNAGPCLAASKAMTISGRDYEFLVVLLHSESMEARWAEVRSLVDWAVQSRLYLPQ